MHGVEGRVSTLLGKVGEASRRRGEEGEASDYERPEGAPLGVKAVRIHLVLILITPTQPLLQSLPHFLALGQGPETFDKVLRAASNILRVQCALGQ